MAALWVDQNYGPIFLSVCGPKYTGWCRCV